MYYCTAYRSPVGKITLACDGGGSNLVGLWLEGQKYHGGSISEAMEENDSLSLFDNAKKWLERYFAGKKPSASELALAPVGSDFRQRVWELLLAIPYGEVTTYGEIARAIAEKTGAGGASFRAVGGAVGHNPISIIIPCHRVVGGDGKLTGYAGGIATKIRLLELEGVEISGHSVRPAGVYYCMAQRSRHSDK